MVSTTGVSPQSFVQSQPSFTTGSEARAKTEQVQPREAPAANTQRTDRKAQSRSDESKRQVATRESQQNEESAAASRRQEGRRGSLVDVSV